tara:strand:+ start:68 stop:940 length:873 start_codon:yes stop_codon:yes gene_type:complete
MTKNLILIITILIALLLSSCKVQNNSESNNYKANSEAWVKLLDQDLSKWEVWTGVPEKSVENLPETYNSNASGENKEPIGLGDPLKIFQLEQGDNGELTLNISGEVYAGLTTLETYSNYHMTLLIKWGEKKYEPRLDRKRDNGLLYHCHGEHGAFWDVWMSSLEYQIQEEDFGDLYVLAGTSAKVLVNENNRWDPNSQIFAEKHCENSKDAELPHGHWNRVDLYVLGDKAIHVTNGEVVLALSDAKNKNGEILNSGKIQIQSEAAECYMKDIRIRPITKFPAELKKIAKL